jgi:hypothetical protein
VALTTRILVFLLEYHSLVGGYQCSVLEESPASTLSVHEHGNHLQDHMTF